MNHQPWKLLVTNQRPFCNNIHPLSRYQPHATFCMALDIIAANPHDDMVANIKSCLAGGSSGSCSNGRGRRGRVCGNGVTNACSYFSCRPPDAVKVISACTNICRRETCLLLQSPSETPCTTKSRRRRQAYVMQRRITIKLNLTAKFNAHSTKPCAC